MNSLQHLLLPAVFSVTVALSAQTTATPVSSPPAVVSLGTGFDYTRGDYGFTTSTKVFSYPLNLGYESNEWALNAGLSYLRIEGPATVVDGSGAVRPTAAAESGFGDIYLGATRHFGPVIGLASLDGTFRVKLPTANEDRGLGTGATDYYGELTFSRSYERVTPFATAGYRVLGDTAAYQLRDGVYASGGAHYRVSPVSVLTTVLAWRQPIVIGGDDSIDATLMFTHDFAAGWRLTLYGMKGFSTASPDVGAGLSLHYRF